MLFLSRYDDDVAFSWRRVDICVILSWYGDDVDEVYIYRKKCNAGITCFLCGQMFKNNRYLDEDEHNKRYHKPSKYFEVRESAFQKATLPVEEI